MYGNLYLQNKIQAVEHLFFNGLIHIFVCMLNSSLCMTEIMEFTASEIKRSKMDEYDVPNNLLYRFVLNSQSIKENGYINTKTDWTYILYVLK